MRLVMLIREELSLPAIYPHPASQHQNTPSTELDLLGRREILVETGEEVGNDRAYDGISIGLWQGSSPQTPGTPRVAKLFR